MLEIKNVYKTFNAGTVNEKVALKGLDLTLEDGDFVTVIGSNGSGKSTLMNCIAGVFYPDKGHILIDGVDVTRMPEHVRAKYIGRVFQDPMKGTAADMQVAENLAMASRRGKPLSLKWSSQSSQLAEFREALKELDLGLENRLETRIGTLSGGQRQRVAIARSLCMEPEFLVADEPIASLDVSIQAQIVNLFRHLQEEHGFTFLFIAHDLAMVEYLCDRVGVMYHGKLVELAPSEELYSNPVHPYTKTLLSAIPVPDPIRERKRVLQYYDGEGMENSVWTEVSPGHFAMLPAEGKGCSI